MSKSQTQPKLPPLSANAQRSADDGMFGTAFLERQVQLLDALRASAELSDLLSRCKVFVSDFASANHKWDLPGKGEQDPHGAHALLQEIVAALAKAEGRSL